MRVLLLSDIHANLVALEAVLARAPAFDAVWCLGDVVGYGPAPNECVARLRDLDALSLTGNHDAAVIGRFPTDHFRDVARRAVEWTRQVISPESRAWLEAREPLLVLPAHDLTLVHASPREPIWEYIDAPDVALENMPYVNTYACLFGHTHRPIAYCLRAADRVLSTHFLPEATPYPIEPKTLLNPGSVGQPRDGDPRAAFAILEPEARVLTHYRVEYDIPATQRAIREAHLPYALAARLERGI